MSDAINECHKNGKIVTVSIGGALSSLQVSSAEQAQAFGKEIYNRFLGGDDPHRPFGKVVLDG